MSAFAEDIHEDIRVVACSVLKDNQTKVDRNIVIFEYNLLHPMRSAFYQSSGTSISTKDIFTGTYFPFYGSEVSRYDDTQNTLIKATQNFPSRAFAPILEPWQNELCKNFPSIKAHNEIFKRFTHFHELKISALIGSNFWNAGGTSSIIIKFVLSHAWDGSQFIKVENVPEIDINICFTRDRLILQDDNLKINTFLRENGVDVSRTRRTARTHRTASSSRTHRSRSRSRSRDRGSSSESDSSRERTVSDEQQPTMARTYAVGPGHFRPTNKGGANTRKRKKYNKNKSKRRKHSSTRRRHRSH